MTTQEFDLFATRVRGKLLGLARRFIRVSGVAEEAEDIVQESLTTLWRQLENGYPVRDAEAMAVRITKTRCIDHYRRQHLFTQQLPQDRIEGGFPATRGIEQAEAEKLRNRLYARLSPSQQTLLMLRGEEGFSLDEIAAATGRPKNSVKASLSMARKQLIDYLKETNHNG